VHVDNAPDADCAIHRYQECDCRPDYYVHKGHKRQRIALPMLRGTSTSD
jgi:hypothetical protein